MKKIIVALLIALWFLPSFAGASTLTLAGFEVGDSKEASATSGTFSIQSTTKRTGSYALQTNPSTTAIGYFELSSYSTAGATSNFSENTISVRFYFQYGTKPSSGDEPIMVVRTAGADKGSIRINSSGNLVLYDAAGSAVATGSTALSANTWYRIETTALFSASGAYIVTLDGATELSGTGFNHGASVSNRVRFGKIANANGNTVNFYYDDIIINNTSTLPGAGQVTMLTPNANGNYQTFTLGGTAADHYSAVDEVPPGTADYLISDLTVDHADTEALTDTSTAGITGTVNSLKALTTRNRNDAGLDGTAAMRLRSATTDNDTASFNVASLATAQKIYDTDPATSSAWTTSGVDGVEIGMVEKETSEATRFHFGAVMVDYTPSGGTPTPSPQYRRRLYEN